MKSKRNKTIDTTIEEGREYLDKCIKVDKKVDLKDVMNKTINGDSLRVLNYLPNNFVDLLIVDPPYNLSKDFNGSKFHKMTNEEYIEYTEKWVRAVRDKLKKTATIYVCCDWKCSSEIYYVLSKYFNIRNRITWMRDKGRGSKTNWKNCSEDIWYATVSDKYTFNVDKVKIKRKVNAPYKDSNGKAKDWYEGKEGKYRYTYPSNFWNDIVIPFWSMPENTAHPTQKPEKLIERLVLASSNEGDIVLDPFVGSGTTSVVAKKLNRNYIGIEKNEQYCVWTEERLNRITK